MVQIFSDKLHKTKVSHAEFNPRCDWLLATASVDHTVKLWDLRNIKDKKSFLHELPHEKAVNSGKTSWLRSSADLLRPLEAFTASPAPSQPTSTRWTAPNCSPQTSTTRSGSTPPLIGPSLSTSSSILTDSFSTSRPSRFVCFFHHRLSNFNLKLSFHVIFNQLRNQIGSVLSDVNLFVIMHSDTTD